MFSDFPGVCIRFGLGLIEIAIEAAPHEASLPQPGMEMLHGVFGGDEEAGVVFGELRGVGLDLKAAEVKGVDGRGGFRVRFRGGG